jgi:glycosyltransferase involved in cell wall biosynthesis
MAYIIGKLTRKKVLYDVFYALHDTYINDRRSVQPHSPAAVYYYILDKTNCLLADKVICFTQATRGYFIKKYNLPVNKFVIIPVGGNNHLYKPIKHKNKRLIVEFHGWFTRMQGAEYFVRAAKKMEKNKQIHFWLIGNTVNYPLPIKLVNELKPTNLTYKKDMTETQLAHKIAQADICVGHLGPTQKAEITISNKMYQGLACKLALIAGDYPATKELFTDNHDCLFVKPADPDDLAKKILQLSQDNHLRKTVSNNGYILHNTNLTNEKIGQNLRAVMENMITYAD